MESKTYVEIHAQYDALAKTIELIERRKDECRRFFDEANPGHVVVVGCGSSYQLSQAIATSLSIHMGYATTAIPGGDLMINIDQYMPLFRERPVLVTVSRSGSTSEVVYAINALKKLGIDLKVVCVACTENSAIAGLSDLTFEIPWAFDESVCQTRSVTNLYAAAMMIIASAAGEDEVFASYRELAKDGGMFVASIEEDLKKIGSCEFNYAAVLADGEGASLADEAALAFNEIAYTPSTFKHILDSRHGPIVLFKKDTVVIIKVTNDNFDFQAALVGDVVKKGSHVVVVSDEKVPAIEGVDVQFCFGKKLHTMATAAVVMPIAQLLSYYHALAIEADPDQPDGLDAWIKL